MPINCTFVNTTTSATVLDASLDGNNYSVLYLDIATQRLIVKKCPLPTMGSTISDVIASGATYLA